MTTLEKTAQLFRRHRRQWVSALVLTKAGGLLAWRSRVSDCRVLLGMQIQQRTERKRGKVLSFYRYTGKRAA